MESQRYAFKLFAKPGPEVAERDLVLFLHRLIQDRTLGETCVDVADYSHVPDGPGVMLICHEAHYSIERVQGRLGVRCATKRGAEGDTRARIQRVLRKTLRFAEALESHEAIGGRVRLDTSAATLWIEDRLAAPNDEATFAAFAPVLAGAITGVWGASPVLARAGTAKERFQVDIALPSAPPVAELLSRL